MATGKTHDKSTTASVIPLVLLIGFLTHLGWVSSLMVGFGFLFGGLFLSPDLDTPSRPYYRWGLLRFIWKPYQWMTPHRSFLSHSTVIAPLFRLVYLTSLWILVYFLLKKLMMPDLHWTQFPTVFQHDVGRPFTQPLTLWGTALSPRYWLYFAAGTWLGALLHLLLDCLSSAIPTVFPVNRRG